MGEVEHMNITAAEMEAGVQVPPHVTSITITLNNGGQRRISPNVGLPPPGFHMIQTKIDANTIVFHMKRA